MSIRQHEKKHLYDFMKRFNTITMIMKGVSDDLAIQAFMVGTTHQFLQFHIISNLPSKLS